MKTNLRLIPNTNIWELTINDLKFYSTDFENFRLSIYLPDTLVKDLNPLIHFAVEEASHQYSNPTIEHEIPEYSIMIDDRGKCRVTCNIELNPYFWNYDINTTLFLFLKRELILKLNKMNPIIEDEDIINHYLSYSIEVDSSTIAEAIEVANTYNEKISQEIMSAVKNLPRLLLDSLGIMETSRPLGPWLIRGE